MSIKRISRRRVVAPIAEYVHEELLATNKEGRKTSQDERHGPDRHAPGKGPSSSDALKASVPINKFTPPTNRAAVPINRFTPPTDKSSI